MIHIYVIYITDLHPPINMIRYMVIYNMSGKEIELNDFDEIQNKEGNKEEDNNEEEETDFGGEENILDDLDWLSNRGREVIDINHLDSLKKILVDRVNEARNAGYFIFDVLQLELPCTNPKFIKYLMENRDFKIKKTIRVSGFTTNYEVSYKSEEEEDGNIKWFVTKTYKTDNGQISDDDFNNCRFDIRSYYDEWRKAELNKILKRSGIATAISLSIIALVIGLSLGLQRAGSEIESSAKRKKMKAEKLTPAEKRTVIPWIDTEEATGKGLIVIGDNTYIL